MEEFESHENVHRSVFECQSSVLECQSSVCEFQSRTDVGTWTSGKFHSKISNTKQVRMKQTYNSNNGEPRDNHKEKYSGANLIERAEQWSRRAIVVFGLITCDNVGSYGAEGGNSTVLGRGRQGSLFSVIVSYFDFRSVSID